MAIEKQEEKTTVSIYLDDKQLKFIDEECKKQLRSRNNYILTLIKEEIEKAELKNN